MLVFTASNIYMVANIFYDESIELIGVVDVGIFFIDLVECKEVWLRTNLKLQTIWDWKSNN